MMSLISAKLSANSDTVEAAEAYLPSSCHNQHIFSFDKVLTTWVCVFTFAALQRAVSLLLLRKYKSEFRLLCLDRTPIWLLPHFFYRYFISYEKEPLQTALLSLPVLFLRVLSLIKACPSFDMAITRTVAVCQTSSRMHSIFDKKQRSGGNISLSKWPHCCETGSDFSFLFFLFFGNVRPLVLLKKWMLVIHCRVKPLSAPCSAIVPRVQYEYHLGIWNS